MIPLKSLWDSKLLVACKIFKILFDSVKLKNYAVALEAKGQHLWFHGPWIEALEKHFTLCPITFWIWYVKPVAIMQPSLFLLPLIIKELFTYSLKEVQWKVTPYPEKILVYLLISLLFFAFLDEIQGFRCSTSQI